MVSQSLRLPIPLQGHNLLGGGLLSPYVWDYQAQCFPTFAKVAFCMLKTQSVCVHFLAPSPTIENYEIKTSLFYS